jgi:glycosyltransferase involved in cell wall biosynthesis
MARYPLQEKKGDYLAFLGRIAPLKGTHVAIEVAQKSGIPLKIAGEIQPMYREYFDTQIKPKLDGNFIEYVGEADLAAKNELLGNARAMLFPIQWNEPFGLVMIEAMAKGTPVIALPGGAVQEVVSEGVSGHICQSVEEMVQSVRELGGRFDPASVQRYAAENFSVERMVQEYADLYREIENTRKNSSRSTLSTIEFVPEPSLESALNASLEMSLTDEPEEPKAVA